MPLRLRLIGLTMLALPTLVARAADETSLVSARMRSRIVKTFDFDEAKLGNFETMPRDWRIVRNQVHPAPRRSLSGSSRPSRAKKRAGGPTSPCRRRGMATAAGDGNWAAKRGCRQPIRVAPSWPSRACRRRSTTSWRRPIERVAPWSNSGL